jgi:5-methylcytosine-specific restriction endonuclease McrA
MRQVQEYHCPLCERLVPSDRYLERHHLVPRSKGGKDTEWLCVDCANQVHELFTNNELRDVYNTIEVLRQDQRVWRWIRWIRKKSEFGVFMKKKKRR